MKIAVCVKQSIDTEALITLGSDGEVSTEGAALIIDPYAEFAVEKAVQLKEQNGGEVILVTVGSQDEVPAIHHALSMGADRAILIDDEAIDTTNPQAKARVLAAVLTEEQPDIILGGYKSGDTSRAQTLPRVASIMGLPQVGWITGLEIEGDVALADHELADGVEQVSVGLPALFTAQQGLAEPRYPTVRDIMQSKKKSIDTKDLAALGILPDQVGPAIAKTSVRSYALKPERAGGRIIEGDAPDAVAETAQLLANEANVL